MRENVCKQSDQQGINLQNIQIAHAFQCQKHKQLKQKMGRRSEWTFLQRRCTDDQEAHKNMLNITK